MKSKAVLVSFIALFAMIFALSTVMASEFVNIEDVIVNDISIGLGETSVGHVSDVVPVEVEFKAMDNVSERIKVKVYIEGYKDEISDSVILRTPLKEDVTYRERFSLRLPSSMDLDDLDEDLVLWVRFSAKGKDSFEYSFAINMQKDLYSLNILSVETEDKVIAGSIIALDIVLQNNGNERLDNVYVKASIPDLGVEKKVYFGDISPDSEEDYDDIVDTRNKKIYLSIPRNSIPGIYSIEIEAYNYDTRVIAEKKIVIGSIETGILPSVTSKSIAIGEEASFDVVLVNPNDRMVVYSLTPEESKGLIIEISEPIVTVAADSSRTVTVKVKATQSADEGTHLVTVNVNSESGLVKQVNFSVNIEGTARRNSVLILTVILAIVFVVLLIVLIVLLTKKPVETEEVEGETSYY